MRQKERYGTISAVSAGSGISGAAECEGRVGRRPSVLLHPSGGGAHGPEEFRAGVWGRRRGAVLSGADVEGVAVCLRSGDHVGAAFGAAHPGRLGAAVSGGRSAAGQLGAECVSATARAGTERRVHAGAGDGAGTEAGTAGAGGNRLDADSCGGVTEPAGDGRAVATGAEPVTAEYSQVAEVVRRGRSQRRGGHASASGKIAGAVAGDAAEIREAAQERDEEVVAHRCRRALFAGAERVCAGLHGRSGGE